MEGRERAVFYGSEVRGGADGVKNYASSTPSPSPPPSPQHGRGFAGFGCEPGGFIGVTGGGVAATAAEEENHAEGMGMETGMIGSDELMRKKRGRPKKHEPESMAMALTPSSPSLFSSGSDFSGKRGRGRPPGSGRCQLLANLGELFQLSAGGSFTPHVVSIAAGEDVAARILSFSHKGPRAVCILSANGAISNVTLRQPGSSGGTLTYEGRFELLSLSGSFTTTDSDGGRSRTGGLSVSLAGPDGRVVGGGVAGLLLAASPIQVVVGSFLPNAFKEHKRQLASESSPFPPMPPSSCQAGLTPSSHVTQSEEYENSKSTIPKPTGGEIQNNAVGDNNLNPPSFRAVHWQGLQPPSEQKPYPDINICLQGE
ncbi:hypothetical protein KSP39_PZI011425 [Platanthera zijinensis]|uniref:AT-hook motif nuclear-localized protein n=1 Tax=Platanthera zijinensis TaxID=2320716 RepID=A0AAP0G5Z7_9ASPA